MRYLRHITNLYSLIFTGKGCMFTFSPNQTKDWGDCQLWTGTKNHQKLLPKQPNNTTTTINLYNHHHHFSHYQLPPPPPSSPLPLLTTDRLHTHIHTRGNSKCVVWIHQPNFPFPAPATVDYKRVLGKGLKWQQDNIWWVIEVNYVLFTEHLAFKFTYLQTCMYY